MISTLDTIMGLGCPSARMIVCLAEYLSNNKYLSDLTNEIAILIDGENSVQMERNARKLESGELTPSKPE
jgi:hypothetical protein